MTETLNIGLVGGGFMGKAHALAYAAMPMFYWPAPALPVRYVLADATEELAGEAASRFGFERAVSDWRRVIDDPSVDVVDIAVPNDLHEEIAVAAAAAGKHILCEKPLARDAAEALRMFEAVQKAGVTNMVAFNYRRTPAVLLAAEIIERGELGPILNFRGTYLQDWSADPASPLSWRFQRNVAGSGAVGDIASHVIDIARFLVGEVAAVNAVVQTYIDRRPVQAGLRDALGTARSAGPVELGPVDVDDEVLTLLRFQGGAVGSIEATRNAYGRNNFLTFEVHGEQGSLAFNYERRDELQLFAAGDPDDRRGFRTIYTGPPHPEGAALWPIPALGIGYGETKIIECHDFIEAVVSGRPASPDFGDGYAVARICDALLESGRSQSWVEVGDARAVGVTQGVEVTSPPAVAMRGITKSFGRVEVLQEVDFAVRRGEVHALVGGNGAGKSTLMKILQGVHQPSAGQILLDGESVEFASPRNARARGVAMIFQEFSLIPTLTVAQNVVLRHEAKTGRFLIDDGEARERALRVFAEMGVEIDPRGRTRDLPTAQWQLVEIAKALAQEAPILIMDEPTASLTRTETSSLFRIVEGLRNRGLAIVYISHRLEEIFEIADRITVLRDGRAVHSSAAASVGMNELITLMVGREIQQEAQQHRSQALAGLPQLEVRNLHAGERVRGVSFTLAAGEVLGVAGLMGSGRTELARALFGIDRIDTGELLMRGKPLSLGSPLDAIEAGIVLLPEDRRVQGLVLDHSIISNILLPSLRRLAHRLGLVEDRRGEKIARELVDRLNIRGGSLRAPVRLLSGGNQQKVAVAKWLATDPDVLILDEPTAGVDIGTKTELIAMIRELAGRGKSIILISSESLELLAAADRILILRDGSIRRDVARADVASEVALEAMLQEAA